jgi:hypothetical protein
MFCIVFQNVYVNINRILTVASRLIESNHYAAQHIRTVAARLDRTWKEFAAGLDERTSVLALSVLFHHKAEQVNIRHCFTISVLYSCYTSVYQCFPKFVTHTPSLRNKILTPRKVVMLFLRNYLLICPSSPSRNNLGQAALCNVLHK